MTDDRWIVIPNWDEFQTYGARDPDWIKLYTELNSNDDWLSLTDAERGLLALLWVEFARTRGQLKIARVPSRDRQKSRKRSYEALNRAGFVEFSDDKPPARARMRDARGDKRVEPAKAGSTPQKEDQRPTPPQQAAAPERPPPLADQVLGRKRPTAFDLARTYVRHAGWQDPHLARTLREDRPELTDAEVDELVTLAETMRGEHQPA